MLKTHFRFVVLLLFTFVLINFATGQAPINQDVGTIRINLYDFGYSPVSYDMTGIDRLGVSDIYYIFVYSSEFIRSRYKTNQESKRLTGKSGHIDVIDNEHLGRVAINAARWLFDPKIYDQVVDLFKEGGALEIMIVDPRPEFVDIPVPTGKYYLAYAVYFPRAEIDYMKFLCPGYGSKSCNNKLWGPLSAEVYRNDLTEIAFTPQKSCASSVEQPLTKFKWEDLSNFWDYIEYLSWAGEIY